MKSYYGEVCLINGVDCICSVSFSKKRIMKHLSEICEKFPNEIWAVSCFVLNGKHDWWYFAEMGYRKFDEAIRELFWERNREFKEKMKEL